MKPVTICLAAICLTALCGCNQEPDSRIVKYEQRITALESNITELYQRNENRRQAQIEANSIVSNLLATLKDYCQSNSVIELEQTFIMLQTQQQLDGLQSAVSNYFSTKGARLSATRPAPGVMPANVAAQIRSSAAQKWPGDYDMQSYEIKKQTEAWYQLNRN